MVRTSFAERAEEVEEKIRLKQYVSLRSKGRHNKGHKIMKIPHTTLWVRSAKKKLTL
jgi:hypothetical protein